MGPRTSADVESGEFTLYDHLLDHSFNFGVIPQRYVEQKLSPQDTYFGMLHPCLVVRARQIVGKVGEARGMNVLEFSADPVAMGRGRQDKAKGIDVVASEMGKL
jgi:5-methyltetrahydropteroyltriglutamate--homocysteine methyltransferase